MTDKAKSISAKIVSGVLLTVLGVLIWLTTTAMNKADLAVSKIGETEKMQYFIIESLKDNKEEHKEIKQLIKELKK